MTASGYYVGTQKQIVMRDGKLALLRKLVLLMKLSSLLC